MSYNLYPVLLSFFLLLIYSLEKLYGLPSFLCLIAAIAVHFLLRIPNRVNTGMAGVPSPVCGTVVSCGEEGEFIQITVQTAPMIHSQALTFCGKNQSVNSRINQVEYPNGVKVTHYPRGIIYDNSKGVYGMSIFGCTTIIAADKKSWRSAVVAGQSVIDGETIIFEEQLA